MRKLILGGLVAAGLYGVSTSALARTNVDLYVNFAPPAVYHEVLPAPRVGLVWVPGYWDWRHGRHHWIAGHWVRGRPGHHHAPARWHPHGHYYHRPAGWRDDDGDGVPNRFDRRPRNPYRY